MVLGWRATEESLCDLKTRIKELGEKSTQVLTFLSFAIAAVVVLGYSSQGDSVSKKVIQSRTLHLWVLAIFPVAAGVLPVKEFWRDSPRWYRIVRWFKFWLLWVALLYIVCGAIRFFRAT